MGRTSINASTYKTLTTMAILLAVGCNRPVGQPPSGVLPSPKHAEAADVRRYMNLSRPQSVVGELVYVPVYSSVFYHRGDRELFLTATLSIHNIHLTGQIWLTAVNYYNTRGQRVRALVDEPVLLEPLATKQFVVPYSDKTGGTGANYIVKWEADREMASPKIEALMISTASQQGISFLTHSSLIAKLTRSPTGTTTSTRTQAR